MADMACAPAPPFWEEGWPAAKKQLIAFLRSDAWGWDPPAALDDDALWAEDSDDAYFDDPWAPGRPQGT